MRKIIMRIQKKWIQTDDVERIFNQWSLIWSLSFATARNAKRSGPSKLRKENKRRHGWDLCPTRLDGLEGPFQYGEWLKVDMGEQRAEKKKLGIVYKHPRQVAGMTEEGQSSNEEQLADKGMGMVQREKGKQTGARGLRFRNTKRTLQGKNEVCNQISSKMPKKSASFQGCEEDEASKATSPKKINPTVEAASQPRREP
ncbi:hypothetical protein V6N13_029397 [Hibiscus sabdariffa]